MKLNIKQLIVVVLSATIIFTAFSACTKSIPGSFEPESNQSNLKGKTSTLTDPAKLQQWLNQIGYTYTGPDFINPLTGTGSYDPTGCLENQFKELSFLKTKAKDNKEILLIINNEITELNRILKTWKNLTEKEKQKRMALLSSSRKAIAENGNNFVKGLESFIRQSQDAQSVAIGKSILQDPRNNCNFCICVTAEGCPCCDWDTWLKKILGTEPPIRM